jgi:molybdenum cofactor biosynthesis enzyme MoaA
MIRVFRQRVARRSPLHPTGGEPAARGDLKDQHRERAPGRSYTNLITSGLGQNHDSPLVEAGLDHIQLSFRTQE